MDKNLVLDIISRFKELLIKKGIQIDRILLYGSYANGTQRAGSDIDIVVISDSFTCMDYWQRIDVLADVIGDIFQPIEAIAMTNEEWNNKSSIITEFASNGLLV